MHRPLLPSARPAAVGALRQGLSVQLDRSVARHLADLMMVSTEAPAWWAAALPPTPPSQAGDSPPLAHCVGTAAAETPNPRITNTYLPLVLTYFSRTYITYITMPKGLGRCAAHEQPPRIAGPDGAPCLI